jgi:hypothetical protein
MNAIEAQALIDRISVKNPASSEFDGNSMTILFEDGEISSSKAGYLWNQRGMHMFTPGEQKCQVELKWPSKYNGFNCVFYLYEGNQKEVEAMRKELWGAPKSEIELWKEGKITIFGHTFAEAQKLQEEADEAEERAKLVGTA